MPFTFSHPALILPLAFLPRKWFSITGLVTGSLAPDFEYFIRMKIRSEYSHTLAGLVWFDLPMALLIAFVFHNLVRDSLFMNLPGILKSRLLKFTRFRWNRYFKENWVIVIISVTIGASSHLFWDSFTHEHKFFTELFPVLKNNVEFIGVHVPLFKILQHSSTLAGGFVIAFALWMIPADNRNACTRSDQKYWIIVVCITLAIMLFWLTTGIEDKVFGDIIVSVIAAIMMALIVASVIRRKTNLTSPG